MKKTETQWWLARLDEYDIPELEDGAHSERADAEKAYYLHEQLGLLKKGERYAVLEIKIHPARRNSKGVNQESLKDCRMMLNRVR